jgi:hypothetical protein
MCSTHGVDVKVKYAHIYARVFRLGEQVATVSYAPHDVHLSTPGGDWQAASRSAAGAMEFDGASDRSWIGHRVTC